MNKSVDFARIRSALAGKKLLGYNMDPINEMVPTASAASKTKRPAVNDAKIGVAKIGVGKLGFSKKGLIKRDPTKRPAEF